MYVEYVECSKCSSVQGKLLLIVCEGTSRREYTKYKIVVHIRFYSNNKSQSNSNRHNT